MKFNYFKNIEDKYKTRISLNKPIIIRLDGKKITKNKEIDMLDESPGGFAHSLKKASSLISRKFNCIVLTSSDEINLVITNSSRLSRLYGAFECQKISSLISQDIGYIFNNHYKGDTILFDARTFNIPENKVPSYILYRLKSARNVQTIYFAKKLLTPSERIGKKLPEIEASLNSFSEEFKNRSDYKKHGCCFFRGEKIDTQVILDNFDNINFHAIDIKSLTNSTQKVVVLSDEDNLESSKDDLFDFI